MAFAAASLGIFGVTWLLFALLQIFRSGYGKGANRVISEEDIFGMELRDVTLPSSILNEIQDRFPMHMCKFHSTKSDYF